MPKGYHHMTQEIRSQIYALKATGTSLHRPRKSLGYQAPMEVFMAATQKSSAVDG